MSRKDDRRLYRVFEPEFWCRGLASAWVEAIFVAGAFMVLAYVISRLPG